MTTSRQQSVERGRPKAAHWTLPLHMLVSLLLCFTYHFFRAVSALPAALWHCLLPGDTVAGENITHNCVFYDGHVHHVRRRPVENTFRYSVRLALIDLDSPPSWWLEGDQYEHLTADSARQAAATTGNVKLLTNPESAGYSQNPISVYYCCSPTGVLQKCIAVVTNTPWGARVSFLFDPKGESVPKALHVSPFMDMQNTWHLKAPMPGADLHLTVSATHPEYGSYFDAALTARVSASSTLQNERAGWWILLRYGFQPQRVACLIYWQAIKLLWKGVPFYPPPEDDIYKQQVCERWQHARKDYGQFKWTAAQTFPWNVQQ